MRLLSFHFQEGFLFGAAMAADQIEGTAKGGCGPCHCDPVAATPDNVVRRENGARACDHHTHWPADLDLLQAANMAWRPLICGRMAW